MSTKALAAVAVAAALVAGTVAPATASSSSSSVGSSGLGDPFFPLEGNGGYDVDHYDLDLAYDPATGVLAGTATIDARAEQTLTRFDLDLRRLDVSTISVNGRRAAFTRNGQELVITPSRPLSRHDKFRVVVVYRGKPQPVIDADGSLDGWVPTDDGAVVLSEPQGSPSWFPVNDYPTDKATLSLHMTVPSDLQVLGNGLPQPPRRLGSRTRYEWNETKPMAPYLTTVAIGHFNIAVGRTGNRVPIISGVDPRLAAGSAASLARIGEVVDWETTLYGPYPFESVGAIVDYAPDVGYSLETQTRPVFTDVVDDGVLVHELAHQWVGDSVTLASWPDIWLHEGFATYTEWLWSEHDGGPTAAELFQDDYDGIPADDEFWTIPPTGLPDASELFSGVVYDRGAMTLHVLRTTIGDDAFFRLLRTWVSRNRYGNVSTADFIALAEQVSRRDLDALFTTWLSTPGKPPLPADAAAAPSAAAKASVPATARR